MCKKMIGVKNTKASAMKKAVTRSTTRRLRCERSLRRKRLVRVRRKRMTDMLERQARRNQTVAHSREAIAMLSALFRLCNEVMFSITSSTSGSADPRYY